MIHQVTSKDGVAFWVDSDERSLAHDNLYAARKTAAELEKNTDFVRAPGLATLDGVEYTFEAPARPALRLIKGGKL